MAPLSNEPDAIRVVLNMARRKAFYSLVSEITGYMRSQLELREAEGGPGAADRNAPHYSVLSPSGFGHEENRDENSRSPSHSPALVRLRRAALRHFDAWRTEMQRQLKDVVSKPDDGKIAEARRKRAEEMNAKAAAEPARGEDLLVFDSMPTSNSEPKDDPKAKEELEAFQGLYHPIPTRLTTIPLQDREEVLSAMMLLLLSAGNYSAYARTLLCYLASALEISPSRLDAEEIAIATTLVQTAQKADNMSADMEAAKRRDEGRAGRLWKVGLASVAGAAIVGVTGGLAAPVVAATIGGIMGSVGLGGLAGFLGIFWMNGALVGALFGAFGAKMTGEMVDRYAREVEDFKFLPLAPPIIPPGNNEAEAAARRLRVTIGINGWLETEDDVLKPWRALGAETEVFALRYEMASLLALGAQLRALVRSAAWNLVRAELLKRTVLATLQGALWPVLLLSSASGVDNPFSLARNRSDKAGRVLADALVNRVQGERAVTLVGYSLGARVVYSCLRTLAERGEFGLVDTVVLIGAPVPSSAEHWGMLRAVVAGKVFNVHSENDYVLGFLYRGTSLQLGIAGLQAVGDGIEGVVDLDLSQEVHGHLRYPGLIPQILCRCGFGGVQGGDKVIEREEISLSDRDYPQLGTLIDLGDGGDEVRPVLPPRQNTLKADDEKSGSSIGNVVTEGQDTGDGSDEGVRPVLPPRRSTFEANDETSSSAPEKAEERRNTGNDLDDGAQPALPPRRTMSLANDEKPGPVGENVVEEIGDVPMLPPRRKTFEVNEKRSGSVVEDRSMLDMRLAHSATMPTHLGTAGKSLSTPILSTARRGYFMGVEARSASIPNPTAHSLSTRHHFDDDDDDDEYEYGEGPIRMIDYDELSNSELTMVEPLSIEGDVPTTTRTH